MFSLGAAITCLIGLDTIELSQFAAFGASEPLNDLYDSQTVTIMFTCTLLLLGIQEAALHARKPETIRKDWLNEEYPPTTEGPVLQMRRNAKRKERLWSSGLGVVYLLIVYHTLCPALGEILAGNHNRPGLVAVTLVTAATLLVPLISLVPVVFFDDCVGLYKPNCVTETVVARHLPGGLCTEEGEGGGST